MRERKAFDYWTDVRQALSVVPFITGHAGLAVSGIYNQKYYVMLIVWFWVEEFHLQDGAWNGNWPLRLERRPVLGIMRNVASQLRHGLGGIYEN